MDLIGPIFFRYSKIKIEVQLGCLKVDSQVAVKVFKFHMMSMIALAIQNLAS